MRSGPAIAVEVVAPARAGTSISRSNEPIALIVKASDLDDLFQTCRCVAGRREVGRSGKVIAVADPVEYRWTLLRGKGELLEDTGPATLFQPPAPAVGTVADAQVEARVRDSARGVPNTDQPVSIQFRVTVRRTQQEEYQRTIEIGERDARLPGVTVTVTSSSRDCGPRPEVWERLPSRLEGRLIGTNLQVLPGQRLLLRATASDSDVIRLQCSGNCGASQRRVEVPDEPHYVWTARRGSFSDHGPAAVTNGGRTSAVYLAPSEEGSDTIEVRIEDSRADASDESVTRRIEVKVSQTPPGRR